MLSYLLQPQARGLCRVPPGAELAAALPASLDGGDGIMGSGTTGPKVEAQLQRELLLPGGSEQQH